MIAALFIALGALVLAYVAFWFVQARRNPDTPDRGAPDLERAAVGFTANFFDALGIGSFATTTTYFRLRKLVRDELIPGSLNVGYALPTATQAFIGIAVIEVDPMTLVLMIAAAVAGSWFGAGRVAHWPRRAIQVGMGIALLVAAFFFLARLLQWMPSSDAGTLDLTGTRLVLGLAGSFFLGTIMPLGIGYYAPCMILVSALGMNPRASFPIMMGACAFLMPVASMNFIRNKRYSLKSTIGMALGGIVGSALALLVVKEMDLNNVRWLVMIVVTYTGLSLLRTAARERTGAPEGTARSVTIAVAGFVAGSVIGLLTRPSPLGFGQVPLAAVLSRGATLGGDERLLGPAAVASFNHALAFGLIGAVLTLAASTFLSRLPSVDRRAD